MSNVFKSSAFKEAVYRYLKERMQEYRDKGIFARADEDALTQAFISAVSGDVTAQGQSFRLNGYKVRGRAHSATLAGEKELGADGFGLVTITTADAHIQAFFLFQAKKGDNTKTRLDRVKKQCGDMLRHTAASQLLVLWGDGEVSFVGATAAAAAASPHPSLDELPYLNFSALVVGELLHGLMLAPLKEEPFRNDPDMLGQIKHILSIGVSRADSNDTDDQTKKTLSDLGFDDLEEIKPHKG